VSQGVPTPDSISVGLIRLNSKTKPPGKKKVPPRFLEKKKGPPVVGVSFLGRLMFWARFSPVFFSRAAPGTERGGGKAGGENKKQKKKKTKKGKKKKNGFSKKKQKGAQWVGFFFPEEVFFFFFKISKALVWAWKMPSRGFGPKKGGPKSNPPPPNFFPKTQKGGPKNPQNIALSAVKKKKTKKKKNHKTKTKRRWECSFVGD